MPDSTRIIHCRVCGCEIEERVYADFGITCESEAYCPMKHWGIEYSYGVYMEWVDDLNWTWSYLSKNAEVERIQNEIEMAIATRGGIE